MWAGQLSANFFIARLPLVVSMTSEYNLLAIIVLRQNQRVL